MENIKIASVCGLCAGCKNALALTKASLTTNKKVTLFKEIVHNENVNKNLNKMGIEIKKNLSDFASDELLIIRAHGEPPQTYKYLQEHNIQYVDCTCKNVEIIHNKVKLHSEQGETIIIIGKYGKNTGICHPEIYATMRWCQNQPILIEDLEDTNKIKQYFNNEFYLTCQTTFNEKKADNLIHEIERICTENNNKLTIDKSICAAQSAINTSSLKLAENCDIMLVVGSKTSSNTTELFNNLSKVCKTIFIENQDNIKQVIADNSITKDTQVGITAGASTDPEELIKLKKIIEGEICQTI